MRKFLKIITAAVLSILLLTACGKRDPIATTAEEFKNQAGNYISLENYDISESDGNVEYHLKRAFLMEADSKVDFTFAFKKGGTIQLPTSEQALADAGWKLTEPAPGSFLSSTYANKKGQTLSIRMGESLLYKNVTEYSLQIENYFSECDENGKWDLVKNKDVPTFTILGKITNKSSMSDIIAVMGQPWTMTFTEASSEDPISSGVAVIKLSYGKHNNGNYVGNITFLINAETDELIYVYATYLEVS